MTLLKKIFKYSLVTILTLFFLLVFVGELFTSDYCEDNPQDVFLCD